MSRDLFNLAGRTALVTGSGGGLGLSIARGLGRAGARLVLNGRDAAKLERAATALAEEGIEASTAVFDVTDPGAVASGVARVEAEIGALDVLVNNAGITRRMPLEDLPFETWREVMGTNVDAVFCVGQAAARHMIPRGRGKIINVASLMSEVARPAIAPYTTAKGAVKSLTKAMCVDWARHGLQVNAIGPGYFETELTRPLAADPAFDAWLKGRTPAGRWGRVEDLHGAAVFLASAASDFVNGQVIYVDGGLLASI